MHNVKITVQCEYNQYNLNFLMFTEMDVPRNSKIHELGGGKGSSSYQFLPIEQQRVYINPCKYL